MSIKLYARNILDDETCSSTSSAVNSLDPAPLTAKFPLGRPWAFRLLLLDKSSYGIKLTDAFGAS